MVCRASRPFAARAFSAQDVLIFAGHIWEDTDVKPTRFLARGDRKDVF